MKYPEEALLRPVTRRTLERYAERDVWDGHSARANIKLIRVEGRPFVVKDFAGKGLLMRAGLGRALLAHEWRIYRRLAGIPGIPKVYKFVDSEAYIMEYVESKPLKDFNWEPMSGVFIERLERLVDRMHERGVVHFDLHQRRNVLVTPDDRPYLIDFATAVNFGGSALAQEVLMPIFRNFDLSGIVKVKWRHTPHLMTDKDNRLYGFMKRYRRLWIFTPVHVSRRKPHAGQ